MKTVPDFTKPANLEEPTRSAGADTPCNENALATAPCSLDGTRVVFVLSWLVLGGAERQAIRTAQYLRDRSNADVQVWGFGEPEEGAALCERLGIRWRYSPFTWKTGNLRRLQQLCRLAAALRRERPDALLPYCGPANVACSLIWRLTGARTCIWNQRDRGLHPIGSGWDYWAIRSAPMLVSNAAVNARALSDRYGVRLDRVRLIPNGVELDKPKSERAAWRLRLGAEKEDFVGCMLAHIHKNKDHECLLHAWRVVVDQCTSEKEKAILVLAGRKDGARAVQKIVDQLSLSENVRLLGHVQDVSGLLRAVDVGILSSRSEGLPNAVMEYMASGLPVLGTDIEGIQEIVGGASEHLLTRAGDWMGLAEKISLLRKNREYRLHLGRENQHRVKELYPADGPGRATAELIALAVGKQSPVRSTSSASCS